MQLSTPPLDYQVSEETKKIWRLELEMTDVLLDFCRKHVLQPYACYGTLLGAARHKGFIPWDDDIDFVMMRNDYDKLLNIIESGDVKLPKHYEFDTADISVIKLRRSDTTMVNPNYRWSKDLNQGVWIDVFCMDVAPDNKEEYREKYAKLLRRVQIYRNRKIGFYAMVLPNLRRAFGHWGIKLFFVFNSIKKYREKTEDVLRNDTKIYSGQKLWGWLIWSIIRPYEKIVCYNKSWFDEVVMLPFEDRVLPCPVGWEQILTAQYGEWRTPVMGGSQHEGSCVDINKPYTEYLEQKLKEMPWWKRYWYKH